MEGRREGTSTLGEKGEERERDPTLQKGASLQGCGEEGRMGREEILFDGEFMMRTRGKGGRDRDVSPEYW